MSESLLFAILGFLIACLFGTVMASFLWRRAVTVTKRKLGVTGNDESNTDALNEIDDLRRQLGERDNKIRNLKSESDLRVQDQAANDAEARDEVKRQLTSAARELEKAAAEKAKLAAELDTAEEKVTGLTADLATQTTRVAALESAIRTLISSANLPSPAEMEAAVEPARLETAPTETKAPEARDAAAEAETTPEPVQAEATDDPDLEPRKDDEPTDDEASNTLVANVSRSLDDRIQALMQGQKPH